VIYPVSDIFVSEQGEGHFVGYRMAFVRLAGCGVLDCRIRAQCDEAPWKSQWRLRACDIVDTIKGKALSDGPFCAVCITGGEPTDHDLLPLIAALRAEGWPVHMETSGVRSVVGYPLEWLTVSPKTNDYVQRTGHTLKVVVMPDWGDGEPAWAKIKGASDGATFFHYYLQPLYGANDKPVNLEQVKTLLRSPMNGRGKWALSWQAHKHWDVK
jgi:organic radical activating enzyme